MYNTVYCINCEFSYVRHSPLLCNADKSCGVFLVVMDTIHGFGDLPVEGGLLRGDSRQHEGQEVRGGLLGYLHDIKVNV